MKTIHIFFTCVLLALISVNVSAHTGTATSDNSKTDTLKVWGNCSMCKNRIETAARDAGASSATWDVKTKILTVSFDQSVTNRDAISRKVASVGHDTEKYRAPDDVYDKLPSCCHYDRIK
jgi:copper chaperone CopZ